jgi:hypothetical protein
MACGNGPHREDAGQRHRHDEQEMTVMAAVEHVGKGFERERGGKENGGHEHGKQDAREDRARDSRDG